MKKEEVFIGVSGGVDSAAAVLILKESGYNVTGVYINMIGEENYDIDTLKERLGIDIIKIDICERFNNEIIKPFVNAYINGETPSPCSWCNPLIKWRVLIETADKIAGPNAKVATGHYAQITEHKGKLYLKKAKDELKNQSYYLWRLPQSTLKRAIFPLGGYLKSELKEMMSLRGYEFLTKKKESMGVCFLKGSTYQEFLISQKPELKTLDGGELVNSQNIVIGHHKGYPFYTLAQRRGLNIKKGECIIKIDMNTNRLYVGNPSDLMTKKISVKDYTIVDKDDFFSSKKLSLCVRGVGENPSGYCKVIDLQNGTLSVELLSSEAWAVTSGQPVVFYIDNIVVGGGVCV